MDGGPTCDHKSPREYSTYTSERNQKDKRNLIWMDGWETDGWVVPTLTFKSLSVGSALFFSLSWCRIMSSCWLGDRSGLLEMSANLWTRSLLKVLINKHKDIHKRFVCLWFCCVCETSLYLCVRAVGCLLTSHGTDTKLKWDTWKEFVVNDQYYCVSKFLHILLTPTSLRYEFTFWLISYVLKYFWHRV